MTTATTFAEMRLMGFSPFDPIAVVAVLREMGVTRKDVNEFDVRDHHRSKLLETLPPGRERVRVVDSAERHPVQCAVDSIRKTQTYADLQMDMPTEEEIRAVVELL